MWDDFENIELPPGPDKKSRSVWWVLLSLVLIVALLGSSALGLFWLWQQHQVETAQLQRSPATAESRASIITDEIEDEVDVVEATAVSTAVTTVSTPSGPIQNRIVFVDQNGQIGTVSPAGDELRILTNRDKRYSFPAWSPDGSQIAAVGINRASATINVLVDDEDGETAVVYDSSEEPPFYLYWSPDSQKISFLASHPDDPMALHLVDADGEAESHIISTGGPFYWIWSQNSMEMLVHIGITGEDARLAFVGIDGDDVGDDLAVPGFFQTPGISADGRFLAYAEEVGLSGSRIVIADQQAGRQFQERHGGVVAMGWSPANNKLAYISSADDEGNGFYGPLRLVDAETNEITVLSRQEVLAFFWSPNGRYLAYIRPSGKQANANAKRQNVTRRLFAIEPAQQFQLPHFDVVVVDTETGNGQVLLRQAQLSFEFLTQFLPFFDQYALSHRIWSPAGDALVLPLIVDNQEQISVVSINSGRVQFLAEGSIGFWSWQ
ncbi:MAG: PD40 domain-containing protein [Anaerolineales bacterium]|nr:PD40 domain-containing protein [Anaerolineales bacterium]